MTSTAQPARVEPTLDPAPATQPDPPAVAELRAAVGSATPAVSPTLDRASLDQLSRIEEKTARIEEKYARTEALMQRLESKVEHTTNRAAEMARQADLIAVRAELDALARRTRRLPGLTSLVFLAIVSILLTVAGVVAVLRYGIPGVLPR